jgi:hypothetical protein
MVHVTVEGPLPLHPTSCRYCEQAAAEPTAATFTQTSLFWMSITSFSV